ncbi:zinc finger protein 827 [Protopterus annectens]|uniref:zinc finger protein 827 n=1 Tax=Protopterus annectens TaxID=7888 RepID=UPI001CFAAECA|nr:zinc finger protein 827 [Protopterus annectens]
MPRRKQEQPKRLPSHANREEEVEGELSTEEDWFGNTSESVSEASYGELQETFKAAGEDSLPEQSTSSEGTLGNVTPAGNSLDLLCIASEGLSETHIHFSSFYGDGIQGLNRPLSSNLRRLLEAGSLKLDTDVAVASGGDSAINQLSSLSASPSAHHAQQLSALARKLAVKQEQNEQQIVNNSLVWSHGQWLQNSASCSLSPDSAILKLKAAANAVLHDKSLSRTEEPIKFENFSSPFSPQSASSTLAALSKKVSERKVTSGQDHQPLGGPFLSLASMTSSAALLKEVAARAAGNLLADRKEQLVPKDTLQQPDRTPDKTPSSQSLELLLLPASKGRTLKTTSQVSEEEGGKPFQCPVCGLIIKRKSYWKRHMVIHTGLKSHQCPLCPFRCARKDNLKSHMKVHQHQDRGETFQCQLCPFTSSRHFSLKLHMRCHQHFSRMEAKVKEEITETEIEATQLNESAVKKECGTDPLGGSVKLSTSPLPTVGSRRQSVIPRLVIKEEPSESNIIPAVSFQMCAEQPAEKRTLKDTLDYIANRPTALFSQDISVKMASELLMKLSAANQKEPLSLPTPVTSEPEDEETTGSLLTQPGYAVRLSSEASVQNISNSTCNTSETKSNLLSQDVSVKVASDLLMKLSAERIKESDTLCVKIKEEPMDIQISEPTEPSSSPAPAVSFNCLPSQEKKDHLLPVPAEGQVIPERNLFNQDISVKMASELLYKLSEKVNKGTDQFSEGIICNSSSPYLYEDNARQSPFTSNSKDNLPHETGLQGQAFSPGRKYKCHLCSYAAKCRANLNQHLTVHSVKLVTSDTEEIVSAVGEESADQKSHPYYYSCHVCGFETEQNFPFVSHMSLHVDKEQWMFSLCCSSCEFVTMEESEMKAHATTMHPAEKQNVISDEHNSTCSSSLSADSVNGGEDTDSSQKSKDLSSELTSPSASAAQPSLSTEDKTEKGFECIFCSFVCKAKNMFDRHLQIHLITRMFECDICHKFMKTPEQLMEHKKCHTVPTGGLKCPFCIYSTNRPAALECHLKTHYKMEYKCRICQAVRANQLELEVHVREHRLGNHYKCDQCGYLSKTANKLIEHVRVHTGERPFHCDQCSYSCKRKDNLNLHKKLKHAPRQTFSCSECMFKTTHPFVFSRHVKKHLNGEYPEEEKGQSSITFEATSPIVASKARSLLSPLSHMTASQALQTVAMSATQGGRAKSESALNVFTLNGTSSHFDNYRNCDFAHLIPLTLLVPRNQFDTTFHAATPQTAPSEASSPKHSFLAYLGLTEKVETA